MSDTAKSQNLIDELDLVIAPNPDRLAANAEITLTLTIPTTTDTLPSLSCVTVPPSFLHRPM